MGHDFVRKLGFGFWVCVLVLGDFDFEGFWRKTCSGVTV